MKMEHRPEGTPQPEILPSPKLVKKIVEGFYEHVPGGRNSLEQKLADLNQYRHFFALDELPEASLEDQTRYVVRYLKGIGNQHAFEWVVFHPQLKNESIQQIKEGVRSQLDSHEKIGIMARDIINEDGPHLFDHLLNLANKHRINESNTLIVVEGIEDLSSEELGKFMYDLYIWPDNPRHRLRSKVIMYLPAEIDYVIQTTDIPAMAHKGGIRNTLDRANYLLVYEKR